MRVFDGWVHERQRRPFMPFLAPEEEIRIDSCGCSTDACWYSVSAEGRPARLVVDMAGRLVELKAPLLSSGSSTYASAEDSIRQRRSRLYGSPWLPLPEPSLWSLVTPFHPRALRPGVPWRDTVDLIAEHEGIRLSLTGVRISTLIGDTVLDGRRLWIVRDSATVRLDVRTPRLERTLDTLVTIRRSAVGTTRGRYLYDRSIRLARARSETTELSGTAMLEYPGGAKYQTQARYRGARQWTLYDSTRWDARERRRATRPYGKVLQPDDTLGRRLAHRDTALLDSLVAVWLRANDASERDSAVKLIRWWPSSGELADRVVAVGLQAGDTAVPQLPGSRRRLDTTTLRPLLPLLRDPGQAFAFGIDRDMLYENVEATLLRAPPAITPDTGEWSCTLRACRELGAEADSAGEPRLRDLGLLARLVLDPARWADTVLARAAAGSVLLRHAGELLHGTAGSRHRAAVRHVPDAGADWHAWIDWAGEVYLGGPWELWYDPEEAASLRFFALRTGRDIVGELRRGLATAPGDSAALVYDEVLIELDARRPWPEDVVELLHSDRPLVQRRGWAEMLMLLRAAEPADPTVMAELVDGLLETAIDGDSAWPRADGYGPAYDPGWRRLVEGDEPVFLAADSIPEPVRIRWRPRVRLESSERQASRDLAPGFHFRTPTVVRAGPFARLGLDFIDVSERDSGRARDASSGWITVYLLRIDGQWKLLSMRATTLIE